MCEVSLLRLRVVVCAVMCRILVRKVFVGCGFCVFSTGVEVNFEREERNIMVCDEDISGFVLFVFC